MNVGVAAHITAAAPGGPRFDASLSSKDRRSIENGIWLCQDCAKLVDNDPTRYPVDILRRWKHLSEEAARLAIENRQSPQTESIEEREAERHWGYAETHELVSLRLALFTTQGLPVSRYIEHLQAVQLHLDPDENNSTTLASILEFPQVGPNAVPWRDLGRDSPADKCHAWLWAFYGSEKRTWWKETGHNWTSNDVAAAGVDADIPWQRLGHSSLNSLCDLSVLPRFGVTVPCQLVQLGLKEIRLSFCTKTSQVDLDLSAHGLDGLEWMQEQQTQILPPADWMPLGLTFSGQELLDRLRQQFLDQRLGRTHQASYCGIMGLTGPDGRGVQFFPNMPPNFMNSDESKGFTFTVPVPTSNEVK